MKSKFFRTVALACALLCGAGTLAACSGNGGDGGNGGNNMTEYVEPATKEGMSWEEKLPLMSFGEMADSIDYIYVRDMNEEVRIMLTSLKAIVNSNQPRIYTQDSEDNWVNDIAAAAGVTVNVVTDPYELVEKYKDEIKGLVVYDKSNNHTVNLASTYGGINDNLVVSETMISALESEGLEFEVTQNYNGMFEDKLSVYEYMYDNLWSQCTHKAITSLNPTMVGYLRDYGMAIKSCIVWLNVSNETEKALLEKFLADMKPGESCYLGWFPEGNEAAAISLSSQYGLLTFPSDYCENMTLLSSSTARTSLTLPTVPEAPELENKVYVALCMSDGDNLQYLQHRMRALWQDERFGSFPISWTISPSSIVAQPAILATYYDRLNENPELNANTAFLTGPSGIAYNYPRSWTDKDAIREVMELTNEYCQQAGISVVNLWNDNSGWTQGMSVEEVEMFAETLSDMLAVYDNAGLGSEYSSSSVVENGVLIRGLDIPYSYVDDDNETLFKNYINATLRMYEDNEQPYFLALVANPWKNAAEHGTSVMDELAAVVQAYSGNANVEFVRIDHLAMLEKEYIASQNQ